MAIAFGTSAHNQSGGSADITASAPSGTASGDVLLAFIAIDVNTATVDLVGSGYTNLVSAQDGGNGDERVYLYYKVLTAAEGDTSWSITAARNWSVLILRYTGVDNTTPVDDSGGGTGSTANNTIQPLPTGVTSTVADTMGVSFIASDRSSVTAPSLTEPSGFTERIDTENTGANLVIGAAEKALASASTSLTGDWTMDASDRAALASVILRTASGGESQTVVFNVLAAVETLFSPQVFQEIDLAVLSVPGTIENPKVFYNVQLPVLAVVETVQTPVVATSVSVPSLAIPGTVENPTVFYNVQVSVLNVPATIPSPRVTFPTQTAEINLLTVPGTIESLQVIQLVQLPVVTVSSSIETPQITHLVSLPVLATTTALFDLQVSQVVAVPVLNLAPTVLDPLVVGGLPPLPSLDLGLPLGLNRYTPLLPPGVI